MEPKPRWSADILKYYIYRTLMKRFYLPVIGLYMLAHGLSVAQIATIVVVSRVIALVLEVPSGMISDAIGHKRTLVSAQLVKALSVTVMLFGTFEWFLVGTILFWAANAFVSGTREALFYERLMELGRAHEFKLHEGRSVGIGQAVGIASMALAGVLFTVNPDLPMFITAAQFLIAFVVMASFHEAKKVVEVETSEGYMRLITHFKQAARLFRQHPELLWLAFVQAIVVGVVFGTNEVLQPVLELVGYTATTIGFYYALERIITTIAGFSLSAVMDRVSDRILIAACSLLSLGTLGLFVLTSNPWVIGALYLICNVVITLMLVIVSNRINHTLPSGSRATAISLSSMVLSLAIAVVAGLIALLTEFTYLPVLIGAIAIVGALLLVPLFLQYLRTTRA